MPRAPHTASVRVEPSSPWIPALCSRHQPLTDAYGAAWLLLEQEPVALGALHHVQLSNPEGQTGGIGHGSRDPQAPVAAQLLIYRVQHQQRHLAPTLLQLGQGGMAK